MEIIIGIIILVVMVFVISAIDNSRPVSDWSDEKLYRMHDKAIRASSAAYSVGQVEQGKIYSDKADEISAEINKRKNNIEKALQNSLSSSFDDVKKLSKKRKEVYLFLKESLDKQEISEETFDEALATAMHKMMIFFENEYVEKYNMPRIEAVEKSIETVLNLPPSEFIKEQA